MRGHIEKSKRICSHNALNRYGGEKREASKPRERPYKLSDAGGLYLEVGTDGSKRWRLKYRFNTKEKRLAFGVYPGVTLAQARDHQQEARRLLNTGVDPGEGLFRTHG
jgi:hypothetical protein